MLVDSHSNLLVSVSDALRAGGGMCCDSVAPVNPPHCSTKPNGSSCSDSSRRAGLGTWGEAGPSGMIQRPCLYFGVPTNQESCHTGPRTTSENGACSSPNSLKIGEFRSRIPAPQGLVASTLGGCQGSTGRILLCTPRAGCSPYANHRLEAAGMTFAQLLLLRDRLQRVSEVPQCLLIAAGL